MVGVSLGWMSVDVGTSGSPANGSLVVGDDVGPVTGRTQAERRTTNNKIVRNRFSLSILI